jgi:hypothetical protein
VKVSKSPIPLIFEAARSPRVRFAGFGFEDFALVERAMISSLADTRISCAYLRAQFKWVGKRSGFL